MATANLRFRLDGGALQFGAVSDTPTNLAEKSVELSATSYAGWTAPAARWEIQEYPPDFACPAGWTEDATTGAYYYLADAIDGTTPPPFDLPTSVQITAGQWGKFRFSLLVNGTIRSNRCGVEIISPNDVRDLAWNEADEFSGTHRRWIEHQKENLRTFDGALQGGAPVGVDYLIGTANGALPAAVVWTTIGTTVAFSSTATIPCSFNRTSSTTNAAIDAMQVSSTCSGTAANNFGVACLYRAAAKDVGRLKFIFTDIAGASEDSQLIIQLRGGGSALADAFLLSLTGLKVPALSGGGAGYVAVDNDGNLTVGPGGAGAPDDAAYLTVGPVAGLSAEVDITGLAATVAFASTSVVPIGSTRTNAATNTVVDVFRTVALTSGTADVNFGTGHLWRAEDASDSEVDIARTATRWTNAGALTAASEFIIQLRHAGDGLATKFTLSSGGRVTVADLTLSGLATGYVYATSGVMSIGATQPIPGDAPLLSVGAVSGMSAEVDITALTAPLAFASAADQPCTFTRSEAGTATVVTVCTLRRQTSGTAADNIGGQLAFEVENAAGTDVVAGYLSARLTTAANGTEASELGFWTRTGGGSLVKNAFLGATGLLTVVTGFVGPSVDTAGASTLTFGGVNTTAISIGHTTITTTLTGILDQKYDGLTTTKTVARRLRQTTASDAVNTIRFAPSEDWEGHARSGGVDTTIRVRFTVEPTVSPGVVARWDRDLGTGTYSDMFIWNSASPLQGLSGLYINRVGINSSSGGVYWDSDASALALGPDGGIQISGFAPGGATKMMSRRTSGDRIMSWVVLNSLTSADILHAFGYGSSTFSNKVSEIRADGVYHGPAMHFQALVSAVALDAKVCTSYEIDATTCVTVHLDQALAAYDGYEIEIINFGTSTNTVTFDVTSGGLSTTIIDAGVGGSTKTASGAGFAIRFKCLGGDGWIVTKRYLC